jgi:hypothetical protein
MLFSSFFFLLSSKDHTVEMGDILYSGLDLDTVFNTQRKKGRIIFTQLSIEILLLN